VRGAVLPNDKQKTINNKSAHGSTPPFTHCP